MAATSLRERLFEVGDSINAAAGRLAGIHYGLDSLTDALPAGDATSKARSDFYGLLLGCLEREITTLAALGRAAWDTRAHE